jgi:hypothetical protein
MGELKLKNGQFMRDGKVMPVKIGDAEQIALLQKRERDLERSSEHGITCEFSVGDIEFDAEIEFECICGNVVRDDRHVWHADYADEEMAEAEWDMQFVTCRDCGLRYEIEDGRAKPTK